MPLACVIVTYNPPDGLEQRIEAALAQTDFMVLVDNGSNPAPQLGALISRHPGRLELIGSAVNIGLAAALNRGIARAAERGAEQILLLDHDSTPGIGLVERLRAAGRALEPAIRAAVLVPTIHYAHAGNRCRWPSSAGHVGPFFHLAYADQLSGPTPVDLAIGSGMLIDAAVWRQLGGFDETLFVDMVDTEYCLRARLQGYCVIAVPGVALQHALGDASERNLLGAKVFPTHHSAVRHYYISRNRMLLARRYARRFPSWMAYELLGAVKLLAKVLLFEPGRYAKLRQMLRGTLDGLRGVSGPMRGSA